MRRTLISNNYIFFFFLLITENPIIIPIIANPPTVKIIVPIPPVSSNKLPDLFSILIVGTLPSLLFRIDVSSPCIRLYTNVPFSSYVYSILNSTGADKMLYPSGAAVSFR